MKFQLVRAVGNSPERSSDNRFASALLRPAILYPLKCKDRLSQGQRTFDYSRVPNLIEILRAADLCIWLITQSILP